jgi:hypothetical protein
MKQRWVITIIAGGCILATTGIIYAYDLLAENIKKYPSGVTDFGDFGSLTINPETILSSLEDENAVIFAAESSVPSEPITLDPISWNQEDYLKISGKLNEFIWHDSLSEWRLFSMDFISSCYDGVDGFGLGEMYFFKSVIHDNGKLGETGRGFLIKPEYGNVEWGGRQNFPYPFPSGWKSIDLDNLKISADEALMIGEKNGGEAARLSVQNQCKIQVSLSGYTNWEIMIYSNETGTTLFQIEIDPQTASIIK